MQDGIRSYRDRLFLQSVQEVNIQKNKVSCPSNSSAALGLWYDENAHVRELAWVPTRSFLSSAAGPLLDSPKHPQGQDLLATAKLREQTHRLLHLFHEAAVFDRGGPERQKRQMGTDACGSISSEYASSCLWSRARAARPPPHSLTVNARPLETLTLSRARTPNPREQRTAKDLTSPSLSIHRQWSPRPF